MEVTARPVHGRGSDGATMEFLGRATGGVASRLTPGWFPLCTKPRNEREDDEDGWGGGTRQGCSDNGGCRSRPHRGREPVIALAAASRGPGIHMFSRSHGSGAVLGRGSVEVIDRAAPGVCAWRCTQTWSRTCGVGRERVGKEEPGFCGWGRGVGGRVCLPACLHVPVSRVPWTWPRATSQVA